VRLVKNINISAGLVNGASGTVVKVIFNNADIWTADKQGVLDGKTPPPYCIIVDFAGFRGFISDKSKPDERIFPFPEHKQWVPIYREKFLPSAAALPPFVRKKQNTSSCYRLQFPLDLSKHLTAHRAQGMTLGNAIVSVDLQLDSMESAVPQDVGSILYVALTRVKELKNLLVAPIPTDIWATIGNKPADMQRRKAEELLTKAAEKFAISKGMYKEYSEEMAYAPDYKSNEDEWQEIRNMRSAPERKKPAFAKSADVDPFTVEFEVKVDNNMCRFPMCLKPASSERHIGIDQGRKNFAVVVIDKIKDKPLEIVAAENYHFNLPAKFDSLHLLNALVTQSDLLNWMQIGSPLLLQPVDRVIVHIEVMDKRNADQYEFTIGLGKSLQARAQDIDKCIVKLSLAKNLRANGPIFRLGTQIVKELKLVPINYGAKRVSSNEQQNKKKMAANIFEYVVTANDEKELDMGLTMNGAVRARLQAELAGNDKTKLDDLGDAFLHAVNELLCGGSNFKQLVPATPSIHSNRTVAVAVLPHVAYWIVLNCTWNRFRLEDIGMYDTYLQESLYSSEGTKDAILRKMEADLKLALTEPDGVDADGSVKYTAVDNIKMVCKQLQGLKMFGMTNEAAGKLQDTTYKVLKDLAKSSCSPNSHTLVERTDKNGHIYYLIDVNTGKKFEVIKSTGKHLNAIKIFFEWAKANVTSICEKRRLTFKQSDKLTFYKALMNVAASDSSSIEMLQIGEIAKTKLVTRSFDPDQQRVLADLILIAMNQNQQPIKAIAASYRNTPVHYVRRKPKVKKVTVASKENAESNDAVLESDH
jgi:hypothetical protein